jgi:hypothetical protein
MKREIEFRGKPIGKGGIWMVGIGAYKSHTSEHLVLNAKGDSVEVVHLCQYTGLKDKNGIKIFEGDIIESNGYKHLVTYNEKLAGFCAVNAKHPEDICGINQQWINECNKVVIGNVIDNPEMVKGGSNEA